MPYGITQKNDKYLVRKEDKRGRFVGRVLGAHDSEEAAEAQVRALYTNVSEVAEVARTAPSVVRSALRRGIGMYERGLGGSNLEDSTVDWARRLAGGDAISDEKADMMYRWHIRNRRFGARGATDAEQTSWFLWGGRAGRVWANQLRAEKERRVSEQTLDVTPDTQVIEMRDTYVAEFQKTLPDVPVSSGVDIVRLTANDPHPTYVVRPVAEVGRLSANQYFVDGKQVPLEYDEFLVSEIERQINTKTPGGIMGHTPADKRSTDFPIPVVLWVGARRIGNRLYAKGYIRDSNVAEYVRDLDATNGDISTSIYGSGELQLVGERAKMKAFTLEKLDFAPPELASVHIDERFVLTSEMKQQPTLQEHMMAENQQNNVAEMSDEQLYDSLGEERFAKLVEMYMKKKGRKMVAAEMISEMEGSQYRITELQTQVSVRDRQISEMTATITEFRAREFESGLDALVAESVNWQTSSAEAETRRNAFRTTLRSSVVSKIGTNKDLAAARATIAELMEGDLRIVAETMRNAITGPAAVVGGQGRDAKADLLDASRKALTEMGAR